MEDQKKPDEDQLDLINAFHVFDRENKGYFEASELRDIFHNRLEDKISERELNDLLRFTRLDQDRRIRFTGS